MIQTSISSVSYAGNASIVTPYPVPFYFFTEADLIVVVKDAEELEEQQFNGTDFSVTGEGDQNGGSIVMTWAVPIDHSVTITRSIDATQLTAYEEGDAFPAKSHERALDKLTMLVQQALRLTGGSGPGDLGAAFRLSDASGGINAVSKKISSVLGIDVNGNALLRDRAQMLGYLGQVGNIAWANSAARLLISAAFAGQLGVQLDNATIYIANSVAPGDWVPFLRVGGLVTSTNGVPGAMAIPDGDIVGTLEPQNLLNKTLDHPAIIDPTGLDKFDVGLGNVDNTSDVNKPVSAATAQALTNKQGFEEKGVINGYPSLDASGKIPVNQIPDAVLGASVYQGTWNAATNTPAIPAAALPNKGWYFNVSVAGTTNIDGISSWAVGDQIISNGIVWQQIVNVSAVNSVNGKTGAVVINKADVGLSNVDNTSDATKNAAAVTLTNKVIDGAANTLNVRLASDVSGNLPVTRLNAGTGATGATWWCGDGTWKQPVGAGDVVGPAGAADSELAVYNGATGKIIKAGGKQVGTVVEGPASAVADHIPQFSGATGKLLKDGKAAPVGEIVGTTDTQNLSNKHINVGGGLYRPSGVVAVYGGLVATTGQGVGSFNHLAYSVPAGMMGTDGDALRVTFMGLIIGGTANNRGFRVNWDAAVQFQFMNAGTASVFHWFQLLMIRTGPTGQKWIITRNNDADITSVETSTSAAVMSSTISIVVQVFNTVAGSNAQIISSMIEFLPAP